MAKCLQEKKYCQHIEAKLDYGFDWTRTFTRKWQPDHPFDSGITIRPLAVTTGYQYRSTNGGQSGPEEPAWPTVDNAQVQDGSILWEAEPYSSSALLDEVDTDTWTANDTDLIVEPQLPTSDPGLQQTMVILSGGVAGTTYTVENEVFTSGGLEYVARIYLTVSA